MKAMKAKLKLVPVAYLQWLREARLLGVKMSNLCFNGKQNPRVPKDIRESMEELQIKWDLVTKGGGGG